MTQKALKHHPRGVIRSTLAHLFAEPHLSSLIRRSVCAHHARVEEVLLGDETLTVHRVDAGLGCRWLRGRGFGGAFGWSPWDRFIDEALNCGPVLGHALRLIHGQLAPRRPRVEPQPIVLHAERDTSRAKRFDELFPGSSVGLQVD